MKNKYYVLFRNNKIFLKINGSNNILEYLITDTKQYPNIPFYCFLLEDETIKSFKKFVHTNIESTANVFSKFTSPQIFLIVPDDIIEIEKRALDVFARTVFNTQNVFLASECAFVTQENINYVCISKSCRMMTITYMKDHNISEQRFIENKNYTIDELKGSIFNLHSDCTFNTPLIYLNGLELSEYAELGTIIEYKSILENIREVLNKTNIIK